MDKRKSIDWTYGRGEWKGYILGSGQLPHAYEIALTDDGLFWVGDEAGDWEGEPVDTLAEAQQQCEAHRIAESRPTAGGASPNAPPEVMQHGQRTESR